nr:hypothetical protein [Nocardia gamkensis]
MLELSPVGHGGTPGEIGALGAFLMGPTGAFITGSDILADRGVTAFGVGGQRPAGQQPSSPTRPASLMVGTVATAQSNIRGPSEPSPQLRRFHPCGGASATIWPARLLPPSDMTTGALLGTATTYPIRRRSSQLQNFESPPQASSALTHRAAPASSARANIRWARTYFVANWTSSGTPAPRQRSRSAIHDLGKYNSRSISVPPFTLVYAQNTPS